MTSGRNFEAEQNSAREEEASGSAATTEQVATTVGPKDGDDTNVAKVARGAGISTAGQGVGKLLAFATQPVLARLLGPTFYGFYAAGVALINGLQIVSRFGMENGVVRYVAHYREHEDAARVRGTIILALLFPVALGLVFSIALFFGAGFLASSGWLEENGTTMATVLRGFAFVLPFFVFMSMTAWATQGFKTVTYAAYIQQLIRPGLFLLFVGVCYVLGAKIFGVIAAYALAMLISGLVGLYYVRKLFPDLFDRRAQTTFETKALFGVSIPMSITQGAQYLNNFSAILILGVFAAGAPVGIFNAAARTATFLTVVRFAFSGIFSPIISGLHARQDTEEIGRLYKDVSRWIFTGAFALFLVLVVFAPEVLGIFGEAFGAGVTALIVVAVAQLFSSSVGPAPRMLAMTGNQNYAMIATSVSAIMGVIVSLILIPRFEVLGAAIGMATAIIVENTGTMSAVKWRLGYWPVNWMWLKPLTAGAVAGVVTYLLKVTLPLEAIFGFLPLPVAIPTIMLLGGFLGILFFGLLWLLGFSETDKEFLGTFWNVAQRAVPRRFRKGQE
ncbi:MAG TPA: flippase [Rubrobacter sp.]|nr:flippase [Rubrobacter sp.]